MPILFGLLLALIVSSPAGRAPASGYLCELTPGPPARVRVFHRGKQVGSDLTYRHQARMASADDIDGDGRLDLLLLVLKTTRYDPRPGWRPFVYTVENGEWVPKWLGSRLGRPLLEAALVRTSAGVRLLSIEDFGGGTAGLTLYHWRGFGFWGEWTGPAEPALSDLRVADEDGDGVDEVSLSCGERRVLYHYRNGGYTAAGRRE